VRTKSETIRNTNLKLLLAVVANKELVIAAQRYLLCTNLTLLHSVSFLVVKRTKQDFDSSFHSDRLFLPMTLKLTQDFSSCKISCSNHPSLTSVYKKFVFVSTVSRKSMYVVAMYVFEIVCRYSTCGSST